MIPDELRELRADSRRIVQSMAEEFVARGVDVDIIQPRAEQRIPGRTHDVDLNKEPYEIKEARTKQTSVEGISRSISGLITDAAGQNETVNVLIDARGVKGMTKDIAVKAMRRAGGRLDKRGNASVRSMTVLTPEDPVIVRRTR